MRKGNERGPGTRGIHFHGRIRFPTVSYNPLAKLAFFLTFWSWASPTLIQNMINTRVCVHLHIIYICFVNDARFRHRFANFGIVCFKAYVKKQSKLVFQT